MPTHKMLSPLRTNISNPSTSESTSIVFEIHHYDYAKIEYPSNLYNSFDKPPINENQGNGWSRISKDYDQELQSIAKYDSLHEPTVQEKDLIWKAREYCQSSFPQLLPRIIGGLHLV